MRELKFRVWSVNDKEVVPTDCYYIHNLINYRASEFFFGILIKDWKEWEKGDKLYLGSYLLEEFVDKKDKNGSDIYTGDELMYRGYLGVVHYSEPNHQFCVWINEHKSNFTFDEMSSEEIEIIGNENHL